MHAFPREIDAGIKPEQVERRFDAQRIEHLVGGEVLDADEKIAGQRAEALGQPPIGGIRDRLELGEVRRFELAPVGPAHAGIIPGCRGPSEANLNGR